MTLTAILSQFPRLNSTTTQLTSPRTPAYNCIAYAAGDHQRWWWPDPDGLLYWPLTAQRSVRLPSFQQAFETLGYRLCSETIVEAGVEKVAIFSKGSVPTHAAKQLPTGTWSSKLGRSEDISHDLYEMEGGVYGNIAFLMKRLSR